MNCLVQDNSFPLKHRNSCTHQSDKFLCLVLWLYIQHGHCGGHFVGCVHLFLIRHQIEAGHYYLVAPYAGLTGLVKLTVEVISLKFRLPAVNFFEMSEHCNISPRFSLNFFGRCNISRTFGFYNNLINRQEALKGILNMSVLQTIDLKKYYGTEPNITRALDGVNFDLEDGEFVAIVGTSGSGKSTLLHMMGGLDTPTSGNVIVRDKELSKMNDEQLTIFRRRNIGFIFQNYNLVPILNVYENIVLPVELDGDTADKKFLNEIVEMLALKDKLNNMPNNLSGGQQQRVAIARALITKPAIILADEPTGNLDSKTSADVLGLLKRTGMEFNQTIVMITHNNEIAQLADRIVRIEDGKIVG